MPGYPKSPLLSAGDLSDPLDNLLLQAAPGEPDPSWQYGDVLPLKSYTDPSRGPVPGDTHFAPAWPNTIRSLIKGMEGFRTGMQTGQETPDTLNLLLTMAAGKLGAAPEPVGMLSTFGGRAAKEAAAVPASAWFKGADTLPRFEIPDVKSRFKTSEISNNMYHELDKLGIKPADMQEVIEKHGYSGTLDEFLEHPELFKQYPELRKLKIKVAPAFGPGAFEPGTMGMQIPGDSIVLNPVKAIFNDEGKFAGTYKNSTSAELHETLLHEIQHWIQDKEGFAPGSGQEDVASYLREAQGKIKQQVATLPPNHPDIPKLLQEHSNVEQLLQYDPEHLYHTTAGEVEARNVTDRWWLGRELQQQGVPYDAMGRPWQTQDVATRKQLVFPNPNTSSTIKLTPVEHTPETAPLRGPAMVRGYHGTGARDEFENFDNNFIGTGQGAQSYGWGHYFAGNKAVAANMQRQLAGNPARPIIKKMLDLYDYQEGNDLTGVVEDAMKKGKFTPEETRVLAALKKDDWLGFDQPHLAVKEAVHNPGNFEMSQEIHDALAAMPKGQSLEVAMKPDEHELLDYDKKLSEQHPDLQAKIKNIPVHQEILNESDASRQALTDKAAQRFGTTPNKYFKSADYTGQALYEKLTQKLGSPRAASEALHAAGIPGLKYLDQGSRDLSARIADLESFIRGLKAQRKAGDMPPTSTEPDVAKFLANSNARLDKDIADSETKLANLKQQKETRNYVIFDPSNVKITARNGKRLIPVDHDPFAEPQK